MSKRRKLYLEPSFGGHELPRTTQYRASRSTANSSEVRSATSDCVPEASDEHADNSTFPDVSDCSNEGVDECDGLSTDGELHAQHTSNEEREGEGDSGTSDFSAEDIVTLVMDFAVNFGLSWTQVEHLMKLVGFILKRKDLPETKFLFKKFAGGVDGEHGVPFLLPRLHVSSWRMRRRRQEQKGAPSNMCTVQAALHRRDAYRARKLLC
ncbi:hypothetical protein MTO96_036512 [Rhipicephalus appendiculatus]